MKHGDDDVELGTSSPAVILTLCFLLIFHLSWLLIKRTVIAVGQSCDDITLYKDVQYNKNETVKKTFSCNTAPFEAFPYFL